MHRAYGRAIKGHRVNFVAPYKRGNYITIFGAISINEIEAAMYTKGAGNTESFYTFIKDCLIPRLQPQHHVIMDNVSFHKSSEIIKSIESTGAKVIYTPPYSPEYNPIEEMWSKVKAVLKGIGARTINNFGKAIKDALNSITKKDLIGWFRHAGYCGST